MAATAIGRAVVYMDAYAAPMIVVYGLLAAPVIAGVLLWGSWGRVAVAAVVTAVEYAALQRSQWFSAHIWRSIGIG